jgi:acetyltransferase-like isoleucine patch superfamily enzyme
MGFSSLNDFSRLRDVIVRIRVAWLRRRGIRFGEGSTLSMSSTIRGKVTIGSHSYITFKTVIDSFDYSRNEHSPIKIGNNCFIGAGSVICPGVTVGDNCIVAAGAIVSSDVPSRTAVGGNPAKVIRENIKIVKYGVLEGADENVKNLWKP